MASETVQGTYTESVLTADYPRFPPLAQYARASNKTVKFITKNWDLVQEFYGFKIVGEMQATVAPKEGVLVVFFLSRHASGHSMMSKELLAEVFMQLDFNDKQHRPYQEGRRLKFSTNNTWKMGARLQMKEFLSAPIESSLRVTVQVTLFGPSKDVVSGVATPSPVPPFLNHLVSPERADVTIICEEQEFPVHACILKCTSPVLSAMLESNMQEGTSGTIKIEDVGVSTVQALLDFVYHGKLPPSTADETLILELLYCADKYDMKELKRKTLSIMHATMTVENTSRFTSAALQYQADKTWRDNFVKSFNQNYNDIPKDDEFKDLLRHHLDILY